MPPTPDLSFIGLDEFFNKPVVENCKAISSEKEPKVVRKNDDAPCIEEWVSDDEEKDVSQPKIEKKIVRPSIVKKEFVKSKQQEKTTRKTVTDIAQKDKNEAKRTKPSTRMERVREIEAKGEFILSRIKDQGVIDSGCSRHMTGNMYYLTDYEEMEDMFLLEGTPKEGKSQEKNSKAFRVFNNRTRIVKENLHIRFSENTPNIVGSGLDWLFDIDALTRTMNYEPIVTADPPYSQDPKSSHDDGSKPSSDDEKKVDEC
ncbi:hypothetical protein Tco_0935847 [Tanacetum coccineum]